MTVSEAFSLVLDGIHNIIVPHVLPIVIAVSPILLTVILVSIFWPLWVNYVRSKNFLGIKYTVLELRLPKDTFKSPLAMETILVALHNTADGGWYSQYWKGNTRPWFSLELISIEGQVKFIIWTEDDRKAGIMSALYSQFPGIEVYEREDYAQSVHFDPEVTRVWGTEFKLSKPDPYPIKTYIDYGLDKDPKEEFKVDPLVPVIEFLGSVKPNQQVWLQILIRAHKDDQRKPGHLFKTTDLWKEEALAEVNKILQRDPETKISGKPDEEGGMIKSPTITKGEQEVVAALERSITKPAFDVGIRAVYIAPKDAFDGTFALGGIMSSMKQFSSEHLNGFKSSGKWHGQFSGVPWEDYKNRRRNFQSEQVLKAYKRRSYFYPPFQSNPFVLNTEELATIYHFPGSVAATPTLDRVPSKKAEAPANLPV